MSKEFFYLKLIAHSPLLFFTNKMREKMHYRITRVHHKSDSIQKMIKYIESKNDSIKAINGLQSVKIIAVSDIASIAISIYENEQQVIDAQEQFKEIMVGMMPFMTKEPEISNGDVIWESYI